jgi:hypothetical protein
MANDDDDLQIVFKPVTVAKEVERFTLEIPTVDPPALRIEDVAAEQLRLTALCEQLRVCEGCLETVLQLVKQRIAVVNTRGRILQEWARSDPPKGKDDEPIPF